MIVIVSLTSMIRYRCLVLDAAKTDSTAATACTSKSSERRVCLRQLEMRTKLLVGSALLLWLFGLTRPRYFCARPFGWGHI